jgi:hypothetical protein
VALPAAVVVSAALMVTGLAAVPASAAGSESVGAATSERISVEQKLVRRV